MENQSVLQAIKEDKKWIIILSVYTFLLLFFCSKMSPLYPLNEWSDINFYFNIGKCIFNGKPLYIDSFDHKGPLIFFIYGFGYLISNASFLGMFFIQLIAWLIFIYAVYLTFNLYLKKEFAFTATLFVPVFIMMFTQEGGSAEEFILIFQSVSLFFFVKYFKDKNTIAHNPVHMFLHGLLCSMVLFTKINLVVFWAFPILFIFINLIINKEYKNLFLNILTFTGGIVIIAAPICLYLYMNDALTEAYNIYILLNKKYASNNGIGNIISNLALRFYQCLRADPIGFLTVLVGAIWFPLKFIGNRWGKLSLWASAFLMYIVIFMSPRFYSYYPLPFYVFVIPGAIVLFSYLQQYITIRYTKSLLIGFAAIALLINISNKNFFGLTAQNLLRIVPEKGLVEQFGEEITKDNNPTLLVIGNHLGNAVFTKYNIMPNVKYFISPNISHEAYPPLGVAQKEYIELKKTKYIIIATFAFDYMSFEKLPALHNNYELIDSITEPDGHKYLLYKAKD